MDGCLSGGSGVDGWMFKRGEWGGWMDVCRGMDGWVFEGGGSRWMFEGERGGWVD